MVRRNRRQVPAHLHQHPLFLQDGGGIFLLPLHISCDETTYEADKGIFSCNDSACPDDNIDIEPVQAKLVLAWQTSYKTTWTGGARFVVIVRAGVGMMRGWAPCGRPPRSSSGISLGAGALAPPSRSLTDNLRRPFAFRSPRACNQAAYHLQTVPSQYLNRRANVL